MTYEELELNTRVKLREKLDDEQRAYRMVEYTVVAKYPCMCMVEDGRGRRRGAAIGELVVNKVISQEPRLEALKRETGKPRGRGCTKKRRAI
ncbi:MAG: hypothetical protein K1W41_03970 [Lachnospiraceae bacterium]